MAKEIGPPGRPLDADVRPPGSKYEANRFLAIAALADGETRLENVPRSDDMAAAAAAYRALGATIRPREEDDGDAPGAGNSGSGGLRARGVRFDGPAPGGSPVDVRVGESGTLYRFAAALAAGLPVEARFFGEGRIAERPIEPLLAALGRLGARITRGAADGPLFVVHRDRLEGGTATIEAGASSQFASALLLAAPLARRGLDLTVVEPGASLGYLDLTVSAMEQCGVRVARSSGEPDGSLRFRVAPGGRYRPGRRALSGDWATASVFFAAAAIAGGRVRVAGLDRDSPQGERGFPALLARMGCEVREEDGAVTVSRAGPLLGIETDMGGLPDAVPALAAIAPFASGPVRIGGIGRLRLKESDRIDGLAAGLGGFGARVETGPDRLAILPSRLHAGVADPRGDHRLGFAFALLGLRVPGVRVRSPGVVSKSFPGFWDALRGLGAAVRDV